MVRHKLVLLSFLAFFLGGCFKKKVLPARRKTTVNTDQQQATANLMPTVDVDSFSSETIDELSLDEDTDNCFEADDHSDHDEIIVSNHIESDTDVGAVIQFDYDDTRVKPSEQPKIEYNIKLAKQELATNPKSKVAVRGHSCKIAKSDLYNRAISQERAEHVAQAYTQAGVPADKIDAVGFGAAELLTDEDGRQAQAPNRRVETDFIID